MTSKTGRQILRHFDEEYVDRVKGCRGTFPYEKALRKRRVWVEPLFAEAKDWHGLRRFRLRRLEKVNIEALLIAAGQNIKRLVVARDRGPRKLAQMAALRPPDRVSRCRPHLTGEFSYFRRDKGVFQQPVKLRLGAIRLAAVAEMRLSGGGHESWRVGNLSSATRYSRSTATVRSCHRSRFF
jgi:hypothetical protein